MKQLLFLLLLPCLALAQYTGNAGQKITLGEQTTADGLVFRGVENDTALITPLSDTSAYIILDTVNNKFYNYNRATNVWNLAGGGVSVSSFSAGTTGLTPSTATTGAVTLGGTLAVANGGTGSATQNFVDLTTTQSSIAGKKTFTTGIEIKRDTNVDLQNLLLSNSSTGTSAETTLYVSNQNSTNSSIFFETLGTNFSTVSGFVQDGGVIGTGTLLSGGMSLMVRAAADMRFYTSGHTNERMRITSGGNVGIGTASPTEKLHVDGNGFFSNTLSGKSIRSSGVGTFGFNTANNGEFQIYATATDGIIFTGRGSTNDCVITNKSGSDVFAIPTNTTNAKFQSLVGTGSRSVLADANGILSAPVSSITTKENVQTLNYGLNEILQINPVSFDYINKDKWGDERNLGFIVEDMFPVVPEVTGTMNNGDVYLDMTKLIPILTKAIQEQQALIKALEQRIINLENK